MAVRGSTLRPTILVLLTSPARFSWLTIEALLVDEVQLEPRLAELAGVVHLQMRGLLASSGIMR